MVDSIIFDLDGTLWDATYGMCASWNEAVQKAGYDITLVRDDVTKAMGLPVQGIADVAFPMVEDAKERLSMIRLCFQAEEEYLAKHGGILMDGMVETIKELKKDYKLYIVSNCQDGYIQVFLDAHNMWDYFDGFICAGDSGMSKGKNNLLLMERENLKAPIYVGDTKGDHDSAIEAGIPFVFCKFGFGKTTNPDYTIDSLRELPNLLKKM